MFIPKLVSLLLGILLSLSVFAQSYQQSRIAELIPKQADNGKYGYVDSLNQWVIEPRFDEGSDFRDEGLALVHDSSGWSVINVEGVSLADQVHSDDSLSGITVFRMPQRDSTLDRSRIRSLRLRGDSIALLHLDIGVLGVFPYLHKLNSNTNGIRRLGPHLDLDGYANGWRLVSIGEAKALYNHKWREVAQWVNSDVQISLTPEIAFVQEDKSTLVYSIEQNSMPQEFDHVVVPFGPYSKVLSHRYYLDDTSTHNSVPIKSSPNMGIQIWEIQIMGTRKFAGQYLLTLAGDTLFSGKAETNYTIFNRSLNRWGLSNVEIACAGNELSTCRVLDPSLDFLNDAVPIYTNTDSTLWIYKGGELQLRDLREGEILYSGSIPNLGHNSRFHNKPNPFVASKDSIYRLDLGPRPVAVSSLLSTPKKVLELYAKDAPRLKIDQNYSLRTFEKYSEAGLDIFSSAFQNDNGSPFDFVEKVDGNRFILKPDGENSGVYDSLGSEIIAPIYNNIEHEVIRKMVFPDQYEISFFRSATKRPGEYGLFTYDGKEVFTPKIGLRSFMPNGELTPHRLTGGGYILLDSSATVRSDTFERYELDRNTILGQEMYVLFDPSSIDRRKRSRQVVYNDEGEQLSEDIRDEDVFCQDHRNNPYELHLIKATQKSFGPVGVRLLDGAWLIEPRYDSILIVMDQYAVGRKGDSLYVESFQDGVTAILPLVDLRPTSDDHVYVHLLDSTRRGPILSKCGPGFEEGPAQGPLHLFTVIGSNGKLIVPLSGDYRLIVYGGGLTQLDYKDPKASLFFDHGKQVDYATFMRNAKSLHEGDNR